MKSILVSLLIMLITTAAQASDYQIEAIVFEHLSTDTDDELWRMEGVLPGLPDTVELLPAGTMPVENTSENTIENITENAGQFVLLPKGEYKLSSVYTNLQVSSKYRPILHMAWQQPALDQGDAEYVSLRQYEQQYYEDDSTYAEWIRLDGAVRIRSAHFLHADVHILYMLEPLPADSSTETAEVQYQDQDQDQDQEFRIVPEYHAKFAEMKETRRLKLNELYYFDHPGFGLILRVSRMEQTTDH